MRIAANCEVSFLGNDNHVLDASISAGSQMRGFTLSRESYEKKNGIGRGSHTSPKIPVGSVTVDCGLAWDQRRNMRPEHNRLGTTGSGRTWAYGWLCQTGGSGLSRQPFLDLRALSEAVHLVL